jgi:hypothetical protein
VIVLAGGRIEADTTPRELRARGGPPVISYRLPDGTEPASLPAWAGQHRLDLTGLEVGR